MLKKAEKKRRARATVKRRYKVRVIAQPLLTTPTSPVNPIPPAVPTTTVATSTATTQIPMVKSAATSIPVTLYILAQGKFEGIPYSTPRPQVEENPSASSCNMPQQKHQPEAIPSAPTFQVREDTPWPKTVPASTNLFEARAGWPIPPMKTPTVRIEKAEVPPRAAAIPHAMVLPKSRNNRLVEKMHIETTVPHLQKGRRKRYRRLGTERDRREPREPAEELLPTKPSIPPNL